MVQGRDGLGSDSPWLELGVSGCKSRSSRLAAAVPDPAFCLSSASRALALDWFRPALAPAQSPQSLRRKEAHGPRPHGRIVQTTPAPEACGWSTEEEEECRSTAGADAQSYQRGWRRVAPPDDRGQRAGCRPGRAIPRGGTGESSACAVPAQPGFALPESGNTI